MFVIDCDFVVLVSAFLSENVNCGSGGGDNSPNCIRSYNVQMYQSSLF
jgi:hypothetical protein